MAPSAQGAEKIGYINSSRLLSEYEGTRDIQSQVEASLSDWEEQARAKQREVQELMLELESQELLLSDEAVEEKEQQIEEKRREYETFMNEVFGQGGLAVQRETELLQPLYDKIDAILQEIGQEEDYLMIIDAAAAAPSPIVVYGDPSGDLTDEVVSRLNSQAE